MSVTQPLRESGLFGERPPQANGSVCFTMRGADGGASIYVKKNDSQFEIVERPLSNGTFPNSRRLHAYLRHHRRRMIRGENDPNRAFQLDGEHIDTVIEIVR